MKRTSHISALVCSLAAAFSLILPACTHNNGDIGIWFGTWHVEKVTTAHDDQPVPDYKGNFYMQFQSKVIRITANDTLHNHEQSFGTWEADEANHRLHINFPDAERFECSLTGIERQNTFVIEEADATHITISHIDSPDHISLRYYLKKHD